MSNFKIIKKGYSQLEVDSYIERLKNDYESRLAEQKDRIFYLKDQIDKLSNSSDNQLVTSLVSAVEKAKLIENSSKNIYELETKKLNLLYTKMENLLKDENIYNDRSVKQELLLLIQDCRKSLQNNISIQAQNLKESTLGDPVKRLLSKMIDFNKLSKDEKQKTQDASQERKVSSSISDTATPKREVSSRQPSAQAPKVVNIKRQDNKEVKPVGEFDKFLSEESDINGANFANIMFANKKQKKSSSNYVLGGNIGDYTPNESGFDLKEAVNPKEDLDEIMKAFDFYNDNKKKK